MAPVRTVFVAGLGFGEMRAGIAPDKQPVEQIDAKATPAIALSRTLAKTLLVAIPPKLRSRRRVQWSADANPEPLFRRPSNHTRPIVIAPGLGPPGVGHDADPDWIAERPV